MRLQSILSFLADRGTLVAPDAAAFLQGADVPEDHLLERLSAREGLPFVLTLDEARGLVEDDGASAASDAEPPQGATEVPGDPGGSHDATGSAAVNPTAASATTVLKEVPPAEASAEPEGTGESPAPPADPSIGAAAVTGGSVAEGSAAGTEVLVGTGPPDGAGELDPAMPRTTQVPKLELEAFDHRWTVTNDVTGNSTCEGELKDFTRYFNDRLRRIRKLLGRRREMVGMVPIKNVRRGANEVKIVGLVSEVRTTRNGHRLLELEDETGVALVLAPDSDPELIQLADSVVEDEVVGVVAKPATRGDLLILQDLVHPDVPLQRTANRADREVAAAFISDVHFGAGTFLADDWERFVRWINGQEGSPGMKRLARKTRYLVIVGDLVDGVGMFPGQQEELLVDDAYEQYRIAGEQLGRLRDDLRIIVSPGNHDLVRPAEPQPALPPKYADYFPENVTQVGNPCTLELEGVECLIYHGRSFDDWITRVQGLTYEEPLLTMKEMLRRRHLVPIYGLRTPIAPEATDHLVIGSVPDVFVTGHVHAAAKETWRGVTLINSSCWQGQTPYQRMHGFMPSPGRVGVVELDTGTSHLLNFHGGDGP